MSTGHVSFSQISSSGRELAHNDTYYFYLYKLFLFSTGEDIGIMVEDAWVPQNYNSSFDANWVMVIGD